MPDISFNCSDDDEAWLKAQAEDLGIDDVGMTVRVIIRDARKRGIGFGIVAADPTHDGYPQAAYAPASAQPRGPVRPFTTPALPAMNDPAPDFDFSHAEPDGEAEPDDAVAAALEDSVSAVDAMITAAQAAPAAPSAQPSATYRSRASSLRASARPMARSTAAMDGVPGSRTLPVSGGFLSHLEDRDLSPAQRVLRNNNAHFFGRSARH